MPGLWMQLKEFVLTGFLGAVLAVFFHVYQRLLSNSKPRRPIIWILDLTVWIILIGIVFAALICINQGDLRFYVLLGLVAGGLLYAVFGAPKTNKFVDALARGVTSLAAALVNLILKPIRLIAALKRTPPTDIDDGPN